MRTAMKARRKELGMTQAQVANLLGMTPPGYMNIECGKKNPSAKILLRMEEVFELTPRILMKNEPRESIPAERGSVNSV
jgi:transcriptional regulator with XRE-family HTH domain